MMKITLTFLLILCFGATQAQIGIGTTNPQAELDVAGDMLVTSNFRVRTLSTATSIEKDFKLITRTVNTVPVGEVRVLDVNEMNVAPINTINYHFTNLSSDNLTDIDLQYDTTKYIVAIANFRYVGDAIKKVNSGSTKSIGHFVAQAFENGGTWHLEIRNRDLDLDPGDSVDYYLTLVVYDKSFFRQLPTIVTDLGGSNSGTASSFPVLQ